LPDTTFILEAKRRISTNNLDSEKCGLNLCYMLEMMECPKLWMLILWSHDLHHA